MGVLQYIGGLIVVVTFIAGTVGLISRAAAKSQYAALRENYVLMKERADDREADVVTLKGEVEKLRLANQVLVNTANSSDLIRSLNDLVQALTEQEQRNHIETLKTMREL